jgi:hypothetical protein
MAPDSLASLDPADRAVAEKIRDLLAAKSDAIFANKNERMAVDAFYQSRNLAPLWLDRGVENARATAEARAAAAKTGELPLDYMLRIMRDPKPSNTRRDEMARTAAPYLHPKIGVTEFVAPPRLGDDNEIRIVFVDPQGRHVPFKPPPELEAAATGPNTPQQLDLDRSEEDRQLLTR